MVATAVILALCVAVWFGSAAGVARYGRRELAPGTSVDAIIVLGCRVYPSGRPSVALARRARRAVELYQAGLAPTIVFTGGVGDAPISEASAAAEIAREHGVPDSAIITEDHSTSTEENAKFAADLVEAETVVVVTDAYHVFRAERVFARYFTRVQGVGSLNPYLWPRIRGALREVAALASYGLQRRL